MRRPPEVVRKVWRVDFPDDAQAILPFRSRTLATSAWGRAWCDNLERHRDFANRLPRGRTYLRQGAVWHVGVSRGRIHGFVKGSALYEVEVNIAPAGPRQLAALTEACTGRVDAALDLVQGRLPEPVMKALRDPNLGLLPEPGQLQMSCSCPDWAEVCKHVAAVLYGVGMRLDKAPNLLFELRGVDAEALVASVPDLFEAPPPRPSRRLDPARLSDLFDLDEDPSSR